MPNGRQHPSTSLVIAATVVAVAAITSLTLIFVTLDKTQIPEGWLALFIGFLGTMLAGVLSLTKIDKIGSQVNETAEKVNDLSNGLMDAKIRAAVSEVVRDKYLDPAATAQVEIDMLHRDKHNHGD